MSKDKYNKGLDKTKKSLLSKLKDVFSSNKIDDDLYEELIEVLILSDIPFNVSEEIIENVKENATKKDVKDINKLYDLIKEEIKNRLKLNLWDKEIKKPALILFIGVNGAGKTTTIAKLANKFLKEDKKVILAAADTFRAAASEQLATWADRLNVPIVKSKQGQDPASVIYDCLDSAKAKNMDIILADSAGRLQNKKNLMDELNKIYRVCDKFKGDYNLYTVLVLDAGAGQNSVIQAQSFNESAKVDGIIMTKLDGSAKGGVIVSLAGEDKPPMWYVGLGEGLEDLEEFDVDDFVDAII